MGSVIGGCSSSCGTRPASTTRSAAAWPVGRSSSSSPRRWSSTTPASPRAARRPRGRRLGNCQVRVSMYAVTDWASAALDWRLFLPASWDDTGVADPAEAAAVRARRARAGIPDVARHREKWRLALDMLDEILGWDVPARPVLADADYGNCALFRQGLTDRGLV
nr:transposase [Frankia sp. R43]